MKIELDDKKKKMIAGGALAFLVLILIIPSFFKSDAIAEEKQSPAPAIQRQAEPPKPQPPKVEEVKVEEIKPDPVAPTNNGTQEVGSVISLKYLRVNPYIEYTGYVFHTRNIAKSEIYLPGTSILAKALGNHGTVLTGGIRIVF